MRTPKIIQATVTGLGIAALAAAQPSQGSGAGGPGSLIDTRTVVTVEGTVTQYTVGAGQGMPELVVTDATGTATSFILGPYWYLQEKGFAAEAGDAAIVTAFTCPTCETGLAVAKVENVTKGIVLILRDDNGVPLWLARQPGGNVRRQVMRGGGQAGGNGAGSDNGQAGNGGQQGQGGQGGSGNGQGEQAGNGGGSTGVCDCDHPDLTRVTTFTGTVAAFSLEPGVGNPALTLTTASGDVTFIISPASTLLRAGFEPAIGQTLAITAAPVELDGGEAWLALVITDPATGIQIVLRDPSTGLPPAGRGRR